MPTRQECVTVAQYLLGKQKITAATQIAEQAAAEFDGWEAETAFTAALLALTVTAEQPLSKLVGFGLDYTTIGVIECLVRKHSESWNQFIVRVSSSKIACVVEKHFLLDELSRVNTLDPQRASALSSQWKKALIDLAAAYQKLSVPALNVLSGIEQPDVSDGEDSRQVQSRRLDEPTHAWIDIAAKGL